ncbi:MAG: four helix bundle protein [Alphaproteobacteria bacterium]|nr:four helix bundle protein [Alphaproteobacteria bacterium]
MSRNAEDLIVWQKGRLFVKTIYEITALFPSSELYGLVSQMRRAAVSIPTNLAEGCARTSTKEFVHFVSIAYGSAMELKTLLMLSSDLSFIELLNVQSKLGDLEEIIRMLGKLRHSLKEKIAG